MKMHELKVIMIISSFYPLIGGAEQQCQRLCQRLIERGVDVCVVTRRYANLKSFESIGGIPVYRIRTWGSRSSALASLSFTLLSWLWLLKQKLSGKWKGRKAIFHAHQALSPARIAVMAKLLLGGKAITKVAGGGQFGEIFYIRQSQLSPLHKWFLSKIDRFVVLNQMTMEELTTMGFGREQLISIRNGVDSEKFYPPGCEEKQALKQKLGILQPLVISFVGRLDPSKNLPLLLKAYSRVCQTKPSPDSVLVLTGTGPEQEALQRCAIELGIQEKVLFLGQRDNVHEVLKASDIFVLPSIDEGMSNALLEAMSCDLAVIATNVGATSEVLREQAGILVESGDETGMAEALRELIRDDRLRTRLGEAARTRILEHYTIDRVVENYLELYERL